MATPSKDLTSVLKRRLTDFTGALKPNSVDGISKFFATDADFRSSQGIVRGWDQIAATNIKDLIELRKTADLLSTTFLKTGTSPIAVVDGVFDSGKGKGWFTEVWHDSDGKGMTIRSCRYRVGTPSAAYDALNKLTPTTLQESVTANVAATETKALQQQFKSFRKAFNSGKPTDIVAMFAPTAMRHPRLQLHRRPWADNAGEHPTLREGGVHGRYHPPRRPGPRSPGAAERHHRERRAKADPIPHGHGGRRGRDRRDDQDPPGARARAKIHEGGLHQCLDEDQRRLADLRQSALVVLATPTPR